MPRVKSYKFAVKSIRHARFLNFTTHYSRAFWKLVLPTHPITHLRVAPKNFSIFIAYYISPESPAINHLFRVQRKSYSRASEHIGHVNLSRRAQLLFLNDPSRVALCGPNPCHFVFPPPYITRSLSKNSRSPHCRISRNHYKRLLQPLSSSPFSHTSNMFNTLSCAHTTSLHWIYILYTYKYGRWAHILEWCLKNARYLARKA